MNELDKLEIGRKAFTAKHRVLFATLAPVTQGAQWRPRAITVVIENNSSVLTRYSDRL